MWLSPISKVGSRPDPREGSEGNGTAERTRDLQARRAMPASMLPLDGAAERGGFRLRKGLPRE